jgi:hypothetical protein
MNVVPRVIASSAALYVTLAVLGAAALLLGAHCAVRAVRSRSAIPLLALLGGVLALPIEPFWDVNVDFTFAANSHPIALTAFGRQIPLYLAFVYPAFIGWGSMLVHRLIRKRIGVRRLLALPLVFLVADAAIEIAGIRLRLWSYYGPQPLTIASWPLLFGALNGAIPLVGGAMLAALEGRLAGWRRPLLALVVPSAYVGVYAVAGWPMWVALNADVPRWVDWLAAGAAVGISAIVVGLVATEMAPSVEPAFRSRVYGQSRIRTAAQA